MREMSKELRDKCKKIHTSPNALSTAALNFPRNVSPAPWIPTKIPLTPDPALWVVEVVVCFESIVSFLLPHPI